MKSLKRWSYTYCDAQQSWLVVEDGSEAHRKSIYVPDRGALFCVQDANLARQVCDEHNATIPEHRVRPQRGYPLQDAIADLRNSVHQISALVRAGDRYTSESYTDQLAQQVFEALEATDDSFRSVLDALRAIQERLPKEEP